MRLVRKQAHPIHGTKAELHTYQCDECGKSLAHTVKLEGAAH